MKRFDKHAQNRAGQKELSLKHGGESFREDQNFHLQVCETPISDRLRTSPLTNQHDPRPPLSHTRARDLTRFIRTPPPQLMPVHKVLNPPAKSPRQYARFQKPPHPLHSEFISPPFSSSSLVLKNRDRHPPTSRPV